MIIQKNWFLILASFFLFIISVKIGDKLTDKNIASLISTASEQCTPNWQCVSWSKCDSQGKSYRQCKDLNNCKNSDLPEINHSCALTPEMLNLYQDDYEKKLLLIGGDNSKIKIDFTNELEQKNNESCQYSNDKTLSCYYFDLSKNVELKFTNGEIIFSNETENIKILDEISSTENPFDANSSVFSIYPTNIKDIFYIVGDKKIENNMMSWKEIYFDILKQDIVFYANAGAELKNTKKSFIDIKKGANEEYYIDTNLPDQCDHSYQLNGIFINNKNNEIFPNSLKFICDQNNIDYSSSIEVEPLALSNDLKTLHLFVHKYKNDKDKKDEIEWHYLFNLNTGNMKFVPNIN